MDVKNNVGYLYGVDMTKEEAITLLCEHFSEGLVRTIVEALKQEQDEPVAMRYDFDGYGYQYIDFGSGSDWQTREKGAEPLYTKPQTKKWVGLTDEDIQKLAAEKHDWQSLYLAVQAKLKEKNR